MKKNNISPQKIRPMAPEIRELMALVRRLPGETSTEATARVCHVSRSTAARWRAGDCRAPESAAALLRLAAYGVLPDACGPFAGFRIIARRLCAPGTDERDGAEAGELHGFYLYRRARSDYLSTLHRAERAESRLRALERDNAFLRRELGDAARLGFIRATIQLKEEFQQ